MAITHKGKIPCLKCQRLFMSEDKRYTRICQSCKKSNKLYVHDDVSVNCGQRARVSSH